MNATTTTKSVEEIRAEMAHLQGLLSEIQGDHGLCIWDGMSGTLEDTPDGPGFILHVLWAIQDRSYDLWFREIEPAKAALLRVAQEKGCVPSASGLSVDLTAPGCHDSRAWIEGVKAAAEDRIQPSPATAAMRAAVEHYNTEPDGFDSFKLIRELCAALVFDPTNERGKGRDRERFSLSDRLAQLYAPKIPA